MLVEAEINHRVEKQAFAKAALTCRDALIDAYYELSQSGRFATIVLLTGASGRLTSLVTRHGRINENPEAGTRPASS